MFGDSSTTGVATRGATKVVSKAAKSAPDAVTKVGKGLAAQSDVALKSAKAAAQSDAARLASKAPVEAVTKVAKVAGSPTSTKIAKGLATNADAATKAVKVAPESFTKLGKGLAASGVAEGVASKAGLFAEATGKAGALGESTTALAAKVAPVLDSTVAKATLGAAEGAGLAAGFTGVAIAPTCVCDGFLPGQPVCLAGWTSFRAPFARRRDRAGLSFAPADMPREYARA